MDIQYTRTQFVITQASEFVRIISNTLGLEQLTKFANNAEETATALDIEMCKYLINDNDNLVRHAIHMQTLGAKIILLRNGIIPALEINSENITLRILAIQSMGYIWAEFKAMECRLT